MIIEIIRGIDFGAEMPEAVIAQENNDGGLLCMGLDVIDKLEEFLVRVLKVFDIIFQAVLVALYHLLIRKGKALPVEVIGVVWHHQVSKDEPWFSGGLAREFPGSFNE